MSLLFGNLTQQFVSFSTAEAEYYQNFNNATALQELNLLAAHFRSVATSDSLYLVYMGKSPLPPSVYLLNSERYRYPCLYTHLYGHLGIYWRG